MKATNLAYTTAPISLFALADVNGTIRLRQVLPIDIPSSGSASAAQVTADAAIVNAAAAQATATAAGVTAAAAQGTANTASTDAATALAAAVAAQATADTGVTNAATALAAATAARVFRLGIACSDETTALTTGTAKVTFRMPCAVTLTAVRASIATVSSSGIVTVDINEAGATILSTKLTIDVGEKTSVTAAVPPVISDAALADDAEITVDIDVAGTGAKGLKIFLIGTW